MRSAGGGAGTTLKDAVRGAVRATRRQAAGAVLLATVAVVPALLLLAWAAGDRASRAGPLVLLVIGGVMGLALLVVLTRRWVLAVDEDAVAAAAERAQGLPDGRLRGVLELGRDLPTGGSRDLFRRRQRELAATLTTALPALAGDLGRRIRQRRARALAGTAALTLAALLAGLVAPDRARAAWAPLLRPVEHLAGPTLPALEVLPGDTSVERGTEVVVRVRAPVRRRVTMHWRVPGAVPGARVLPVDAGRATGALGPVHAATEYWVSAPDGAVTDTFRLETRDPLLVAELAVDVVYPSHTGLEADRYAGDTPPLRLPEGTLLRIRGRATRAPGAVTLSRDDGAERAADVTGTAFAVDWRTRAGDSGEWEWRLRERDRAAAGPLPARLPPLQLTVVSDGAPGVRITVPGADTLMPASRRQTVVADASDDYGIASGALVFRRAGEADSTTVALPVSTGASRWLLRGVLDASGLDLAAGDAVEYHVTARDNSPAGHVGRSATYVLRLADMDDLRDRAGDEMAATLEAARRVAERTRSLESATRDLSRRARTAGRQSRTGSVQRSGSRPLGFEESAEARDVLGEHESVLAEVEALRDRLAELDRALREAGLSDPELQRRVDELRDLYARLASPELRASMERLRAAVESLDPEAVREALERLAGRQEELRRQIEESLDMMRRAAAEQEMNALARGAEELAVRQDALTESGSLAQARQRARQAELIDRTGELAGALDSLRQQLRRLGERAPAEAADRAGQAGRSAAESMDGAVEAARRGREKASTRSGQEASESLRSAARTLDEARESMAAARARQAREAIRQATRETLELAEREEGLRRGMERARQQGGVTGAEVQAARSEQAALYQGLMQLGRRLSEARRRSAMLDPGVVGALERAKRDMQRTADGLADPSTSPPLEAAAGTVESLNQLAMSLLENAGRIQQTRRGGGDAQQAMQRLAELAQEQGALNGQVGVVAPGEPGQRAPAGQLRELARKQAGIGRRIDEAGAAVRDREDVLGRVDELAGEAEQIAGALEAGRLDPEVRARQERLFHRLLDAGRSLEGDEYSDERVAERASAAAAEAPAPLDPELLDTGLRYPVPTADQLRSLPPAYRTLILEYFDRLNRDRGSGGDGAGGRDGIGGGTSGGTGGGTGGAPSGEGGTGSEIGFGGPR